MIPSSPKVKVTSLYFSPKVTHPQTLYGVKIKKILAIKNPTWAPLTSNVKTIV
jgi:hypothetical protein